MFLVMFGLQLFSYQTRLFLKKKLWKELQALLNKKGYCFISNLGNALVWLQSKDLLEIFK